MQWMNVMVAAWIQFRPCWMSIIYTQQRIGILLRFRLFLCDSTHLNVEWMQTETKKWSASILRKTGTLHFWSRRRNLPAKMRETIGANWCRTIAENFHWPTVSRVTTKKTIPLASKQWRWNHLSRGMIGTWNVVISGAGILDEKRKLATLETEASSELFFFIRKMLWAWRVQMRALRSLAIYIRYAQ